MASSSADDQVRKPMQRPGFGSSGARCDLICNHFASRIAPNQSVNQYDVTIIYQDDPKERVLIRKEANRKVMEKLKSQLGPKVVFDGERNLYTLDALEFQTNEFNVSLDREQRLGPRALATGGDDGGKKRRTEGSRYKVRISFSTRVEMDWIGSEDQTSKAQDALRVLDVLLREQAARQNYLQLRECYFHESLGTPGNLGEGVQSWRGYHASFRIGVKGLTLNLDPSTTIVLKDQPVHEFLGEFLGKPPNNFRPEDMTRAKRILKGVELKVYAGTKHKFFGFSDEPPSSQSFDMKERSSDGSVTTVRTTVQEYYNVKYRQTLQFPRLPCVNVGKAARPVYIPMEFCSIVPGQRYKRKLNGNQIRKHMEEARQKPDQRMQVIHKGMGELLKNAEVDLRTFNVRVESKMLSLQGRVLQAPSLKFGKCEETPDQGQWNFNRKTVARPATITNWSVVSFARGGEQEARQIAMQLKECAERKGLNMGNPVHVIAEQPRNAGRSPGDRVSSMRDEMKARMKSPPHFILAILPQKDSDLYAPFKRMFLTQIGVINQCIVPPRNLKDQYLTNVLLKVNAKCGGYNSVLSREFSKQLPKISERPTMIVGMDVSHGQTSSTGPSVAAMVGSRDWPRVTQFAARYSLQRARQEDIANIPEMFEQLLMGFKASSMSKGFPEHVIVFRDGVSESQFEAVLTMELMEMVQVCERLKFKPKFTLVVAQKRHHTRFMPAAPGAAANNIRPGTVVDQVVTHPTNFDFFLSSHKGLIGTTRPTHYIVLHDEIGFTPDEMQNTVNQLCYTYVKSTTSVSVVSPVYYAHLAAQKGRNFMSLDHASETGSSHAGRDGGAEDAPFPDMPKLKPAVADSMFFV